MENPTPTTSQNDQQTVIALLTEQNHTLHQLLDFHLKHEQAEKRRRIINFCLHAIPYVVIIVLITIGYIMLQRYLAAINAEIVSLHEKYNAMATATQSMLDKITGIPDAIVTGIKNIKLF